MVSIDTDFGELIFLHRVPHAGLVRLPDIPSRRRIALMAELIDQHRDALESGAVISARSGRIRISRSPAPQVAYPDEYGYIAARQEITVGDGSFGPVSAEVWANRDKYAARYHYDVAAIFRDLRSRQTRSKRLDGVGAGHH